MEIRTNIDSDESISKDIEPFKYLFLSDIVGIVLRERCPGDNHVCFDIICEDDGVWYKYNGTGPSSYWIDDYIFVLTEVKKWMEINCKKDKHGFGWSFSDEESQETT